MLKGFALKQNPDAIYLLGLLTTYCADLPRLGKYIFKIGANQLKCKWCLFESSFFGPMEYSKEAEIDVCGAIQQTMPVSMFVGNIKKVKGRHQGVYIEGSHRTPRILGKLKPSIGKHDLDKRFCSNKFCGRWTWQRSESANTILEEREAFDKDYEDREVPSAICKSLEEVVDEIARRYDAKYVNDPVRIEDFQLCSLCFSVSYCSQACQYVDWYLGSHKKSCKRSKKRMELASSAD
uniref:MYND-type domain-containing protein n=1 Tax=Minutocellus polymorphus TaxID=265543 RepID=A0A7S0AGP6_9STRA